MALVFCMPHRNKIENTLRGIYTGNKTGTAGRWDGSDLNNARAQQNSSEAANEAANEKHGIGGKCRGEYAGASWLFASSTLRPDVWSPSLCEEGKCAQGEMGRAGATAIGHP